MAISFDFLSKLADSLEPLPEMRLSDYVKEGWPAIQSVPYIHNWYIDAICEHLEATTRGEIRNLLITMPPRLGKSMCSSVFWPSWSWTFKPEIRWMYSSYSKDLSVEHSLLCRRLILSEWYQERWGKAYYLTGDQNRKTVFENSRTGYRIATSVGSAVTGRGGDFLVCDDPHSVKEAPSKSKRDSVIMWWSQVMSTRLNNAKTGSKVIIMQRVHDQDLAGYILHAHKGEWCHLCLPNEFVPERKNKTFLGWSDPRTVKGQLLCPSVLGAAETITMRTALGTPGYQAQFQQNPGSEEGSMFKRKYWKYYQSPPLTIKGELDFEEILMSWDMNFKDTDTSSYVVGQVWGRRKADKYLLDQIRERMSFPRAVAAFSDMCERWPQANAKLIEDKANGTAIISTLQHDIAGIIPVEPQGGKIARAKAIQPQHEAGNLFIPDPSNQPWVADLVDEFASATEQGGGMYWDQIDAASQAILRMTRPVRMLTWGRHSSSGSSTGNQVGGNRRLTFGRSSRKKKTSKFKFKGL